NCSQSRLMQFSTGQCASQIGEPAQLEQFSFITASSAVPLRFFASAIGHCPHFLETPLEGERYRQRQQNPPVSNQADAAPFEPVNEVGRARHQLAQRLL